LDDDGEGGNLFGGDLEDLEFQFTCGVCFEIFMEDHDPITLPCSHNICKDCLVKIFKKNPSCPYCRRPFGLPLPPVNEALKKLAFRFLEELEKRDRGESYDENFFEQVESFFMSLPDEILIDIFEYLPIRELGFMALVCKQVRPVSDDPFLWDLLFINVFHFVMVRILEIIGKIVLRYIAS